MSAATSTLVPLVIAVVIWTVFALLERRVRRPLLDVGLLRRRRCWPAARC